MQDEFDELVWKYGPQLVEGDDLEAAKRTRQTVLNRLHTNNERPFILDIDLDAFQSLLSPYFENILLKRVYEQRLAQTFGFLRRLQRKPTIISIARSQYPTRYCPADRVDAIERDVIEGLVEIYQ